MTLRRIAWDDPALSLLGALDRPIRDGVLTPSRLPAWSAAQTPDPSLVVMARMTSGVRLAFDTDAEIIELEALETGFKLGADPRRPVCVDLFINDQMNRRLTMSGGHTVEVDPFQDPPRVAVTRGAPETLVFDGLPAGRKAVEIWLPQSAAMALRALQLPTEAELWPRRLTRRVWAHYGSSISHGMEAAGPSDTWPAIAARQAGVDLVSLGFAGQCMIDGLVARSLRDLPADLISLKLGANVVGGDVMRERAFVPAVHAFLDTVREGHPTTPILIVSPICCPMLEAHPGPSLRRPEGIITVPRPADLMAGALTLQRVRTMLESVVAARRAAGDQALSYMDGLSLFGLDEGGELPDGLHPDPAGHVRIGQRFADQVFQPGGVFAG